VAAHAGSGSSIAMNLPEQVIKPAVSLRAAVQAVVKRPRR